MTIPGVSRKQFLMLSGSLSMLPDSQRLSIPFQTIFLFLAQNNDVAWFLLHFPYEARHYKIWKSPGFTLQTNNSPHTVNSKVRLWPEAAMEISDFWRFECPLNPRKQTLS